MLALPGTAECYEREDCLLVTKGRGRESSPHSRNRTKSKTPYVGLYYALHFGAILQLFGVLTARGSARDNTALHRQTTFAPRHAIKSIASRDVARRESTNNTIVSGLPRPPLSVHGAGDRRPIHSPMPSRATPSPRTTPYTASDLLCLHAGLERAQQRRAPCVEKETTFSLALFVQPPSPCNPGTELENTCRAHPPK